MDVDTAATATEEVQQNEGALSADGDKIKSPNYADIELLINAAGCEDVLDSAPIAWKLLKMRALKQRSESELDARTLLSKSKKFGKQWQELIRLGRKRTRRSKIDTEEYHGKKKRRVDTPVSAPTNFATVRSPTTDHPSQTTMAHVTSSPSDTSVPAPINSTTVQDLSTPHPSLTTTAHVTPSPKEKRASHKQKKAQPRRPKKKLPSRTAKKARETPSSTKKKRTSPKKKKKRAQLRRPNQTLPARPTRKSQKNEKAARKSQKIEKNEDEKKDRISYKCCKKGCPHNNRDSPATRFFGVPKRKPLKSTKPKTEALINHAGAVLLRQEILDRTMSDRFNVDSKCYVCEHHNFEEVSKSTTIALNNGEKKNVTYKLVVPSGAGSNTEPKTLSRGTGRDRGVRKILNKIDEGKKKSGEDWSMCAQKMAEESCPDQHRIQLNPSVAAAANIPQNKGNADDFIQDGKLFRATPVTKIKKNHQKVDDSPVVQPGMSDDEVKRRTGFPNEKTMLSYIFVACDGDVNIIKQRETSLTWYEEWFMTFEYVWNRSLTRLEDVQKTFSDLRFEDILLVIDAKLYICSASRDRPSGPLFMERRAA